jgi:hypothetical protein
MQSVDTIEAITGVTVLFVLVLALAFVIERVLEIAKATYDMIDSRFDLHHFWTRRTRRTQQYIERRLRVFEYVEPKMASAFLQRFDDMILDERSGYDGTIPMLAGDLVRAAWVRSALKVLGMALGITLAFALELDLLTIADAINEVGTASGTVGEPTTPGMLFTGLAMGLGAGPVHKLITSLEHRQERRAAAKAANG